MAGAMGSTAKTMAAVNQQMKVEDIQKTMMNFEKESMKMDMAGEMSEWVLYSVDQLYNWLAHYETGQPIMKLVSPL